MAKKQKAPRSEDPQRVRGGARDISTTSGQPSDICDDSAQIDRAESALDASSEDLITSGDAIYFNQMTRLSAQEANEYKIKLSEWQTLQRVDRLISEVANKAQLYAVSQGGLKFWREAFVGMSCAQLTHAKKFRLGGDPPDFELDYDDHTLKCELVTALPEGLKLGDRYNRYADDLNKHGETTLHTRSFEQSKREYESLPDDVEALIIAKSAKHYPEKYVLVVDILHDVHFESDLGLIRGLVPIGRKGLKAFREVWFRQSSRLLRVSPVSSSVISLPWPADD